MTSPDSNQAFQQVALVQAHERFDEYSAVAPETQQPVQLLVSRGPVSSQVMRWASQLEVAKHECLQRVIRSGPMADGRLGLAFEWPSGDTIAETLARNGPLEMEDAVQLVLSLTRAVQQIHAAGLVHGQISAQTVRLPGGIQALRPRLDGLGASLLSLPDAQKPLSPVVDVQALGQLLVTLLKGAPVQPGETALPAQGTHLERFVRRATDIDASRRPQTLQDVAQPLMQASSTMVGLRSSTPSHPEMIAAGQRLGPWEIVGLLGEGAMGQVYKARHSKLGRQTALKLLKPEQYAQAELIDRFFQEARTVNEINHEHIVEIFDFTQEDGPTGPTAVYCVMELLDGETLTSRLLHGPLSLARIRHIIEQVCSALAAAHKVGVVHRDVKTDNIYLVNRHGDADYVKVLDFGVAKLTRKLSETPTVATMSGTIIGTPSTMAPEQAAGEEVDLRADVYAVGVMLYEMLSGRLPFDDTNFARLVTRLMTEPPPPLPAVTIGGEPISDALRALVMRCLAKKREDRPASMQALEAEVVRAMGPVVAVAQTPGVSPVAASAAVSAPRRGAPVMLMALGVVAVVLIAVAVVVVMREQKPPVPPPLPVPIPVVEAHPEVVPPKVVEAPDAAVDVPVVAAGDSADAGPAPVVEVVDAGAPVAHVAVRPVDLTPEVVKTALARQRARVVGCLDKFRTELPGPTGKVTVSFVIQPTGKVSDVSLLDAAALGAGVQACLVERVKGLQFPLNKGPGVRLNLPFTWNQG